MWRRAAEENFIRKVLKFCIDCPLRVRARWSVSLCIILQNLAAHTQNIIVWIYTVMKELTFLIRNRIKIKSLVSVSILQRRFFFFFFTDNINKRHTSHTRLVRLSWYDRIFILSICFHDSFLFLRLINFSPVFLSIRIRTWRSPECDEENPNDRDINVRLHPFCELKTLGGFFFHETRLFQAWLRNVNDTYAHENLLNSKNYFILSYDKCELYCS